ncbi:MAG: nucleoside triphosphate pyrophosphohydrolase, partial [Chitinivibrionales bacterium]|nr:nucleoside triphosphate pyrophosphohydrolase [Chitinivibrionales bacterium]
PQGCPWDREQTHRSLLNCLLDETYEFFDAVESGDAEHMREELGDLLLQVVLHAQIASEEGRFTLEDVARTIADKIVYRHPHVFGDTKVSSSSEVVRNWEELKRQEKGKEDRESVLDGVPGSLPALFFAEKVQRRVARVGFDWTEMKPVLDKVEEEFAEFRQAMEDGDTEHAEEELGDIMFALVNVARHRRICAEDALRRTVHKFMRRFRYVEQALQVRGASPADSTLEEMDRLWEQSKGEVG